MQVALLSRFQKSDEVWLGILFARNKSRSMYEDKLTKNDIEGRLQYSLKVKLNTANIMFMLFLLLY